MRRVILPALLVLASSPLAAESAPTVPVELSCANESLPIATVSLDPTVVGVIEQWRIDSVPVTQTAWTLRDQAQRVSDAANALSETINHCQYATIKSMVENPEAFETPFRQELENAVDSLQVSLLEFTPKSEDDMAAQAEAEATLDAARLTLHPLQMHPGAASGQGLLGCLEKSIDVSDAYIDDALVCPAGCEETPAEGWLTWMEAKQADLRLMQAMVLLVDEDRRLLRDQDEALKLENSPLRDLTRSVGREVEDAMEELEACLEPLTPCFEEAQCDERKRELQAIIDLESAVPAMTGITDSLIRRDLLADALREQESELEKLQNDTEPCDRQLTQTALRLTSRRVGDLRILLENLEEEIGLAFCRGELDNFRVIEANDAPSRTPTEAALMLEEVSLFEARMEDMAARISPEAMPCLAEWRNRLAIRQRWIEETPNVMHQIVLLEGNDHGIPMVMAAHRRRVSEIQAADPELGWKVLMVQEPVFDQMIPVGVPEPNGPLTNSFPGAEREQCMPIPGLEVAAWRSSFAVRKRLGILTGLKLLERDIIAGGATSSPPMRPQPTPGMGRDPVRAATGGIPSYSLGFDVVDQMRAAEGTLDIRIDLLPAGTCELTSTLNRTAHIETVGSRQTLVFTMEDQDSLKAERVLSELGRVGRLMDELLDEIRAYEPMSCCSSEALKAFERRGFDLARETGEVIGRAKSSPEINASIEMTSERMVAKRDAFQLAVASLLADQAEATMDVCETDLETILTARDLRRCEEFQTLSLNKSFRTQCGDNLAADHAGWAPDRDSLSIRWQTALGYYGERRLREPRGLDSAADCIEEVLEEIEERLDDDDREEPLYELPAADLAAVHTAMAKVDDYEYLREELSLPGEDPELMCRDWLALLNVLAPTFGQVEQAYGEILAQWAAQEYTHAVNCEERLPVIRAHSELYAAVAGAAPEGCSDAIDLIAPLKAYADNLALAACERLTVPAGDDLEIDLFVQPETFAPVFVHPSAPAPAGAQKLQTLRLPDGMLYLDASVEVVPCRPEAEFLDDVYGDTHAVTFVSNNRIPEGSAVYDNE